MNQLNLDQLDLKQEIELCRGAMRSTTAPGAVAQLFQTLTVLQTAEAKLDQYQVTPKALVYGFAYSFINIMVEECHKQGYHLDAQAIKIKVDAAIAAARTDPSQELRVGR